MKFCLILLLLPYLSLFANTGAKSIIKNYGKGVVKILLYDKSLSGEHFGKEVEGYLTRGSGFTVTKEGHILTNRHVIEWCVFGYMIADWHNEELGRQKDILTNNAAALADKKIENVYFKGYAEPIVQVFRKIGEKEFDLYRAKVLFLASDYDAAILKIVSDLEGNPVKEKFVALPLGNSKEIEMGEGLTILGYPAQYLDSDFALDLRDSLTMNQGCQCGWDFVFDEAGMMKTDAQIHEGNSGGPAFSDSTQEVVGIATAMGIKTEVGLVLPINDVYYLAEKDPALLEALQDNGLNTPKKRKELHILTGN